MEELFKELEAPPTTSAPTPASGGTNAWSSDLNSLSQTMPQNQPQFSVGGAPFSAAQPFPPQGGQAFGQAGQPFGQPGNQPFGQPASQPFGQPANQPFGQPAGQPFGQPAGQPFGGQPNPFQVFIVFFSVILFLKDDKNQTHGVLYLESLKSKTKY